MSQLNDTKNLHLPDTVYFDVLSTNFESTITTPKVFTFNESRSNPFVENPEHYDLSILRFTVDTGTLPVFIPSIMPNQDDANKTIYSVSMVQTEILNGKVVDVTDVYQTYITWNPQDKVATQPLAPSLNPSKTQDNNSGYYKTDIRASYIFDHIKISLIVNNALNAEYTLRPGFLEGPRNVGLRLDVSI